MASLLPLPCALSALLLLYARISLACELSTPDPSVGITQGVQFYVSWGNCTTPATLTLWREDTQNDVVMNYYSVSRPPVGWTINGIQFTYSTVYFVLVDYYELKATSIKYVVKPNPQIGSSFPSALSELSIVSASVASVSSTSVGGQTISPGNNKTGSTSSFPSNTGSPSASTSRSLTPSTKSGKSVPVAAIASIAAVALVAILAAVAVWTSRSAKKRRQRDLDLPPPYASGEENPLLHDHPEGSGNATLAKQPKQFEGIPKPSNTLNSAT